MKRLAFLLLTTSCFAQDPRDSACDKPTCGPFSAATNFTVDLAGTPDSRPATWGSSAAQSWKIPFHPPAGYRVRILSITGDLTAWVHGKVPDGSTAGVLWGLQSTGAVDQGSSKRVEYSGEGTMLYVQGALAGQPLVRTVNNMDVSAGGLLEADNVLVCKVAVFLNDTNQSVHIEPTWTMTFIWQKIEQQ